MKTKHKKLHPYRPHGKAEQALTMAVLLTLLSGTAAAPAWAAKSETVDTEKVNEKVVITGKNDAELSNNTITIEKTGKVICTEKPSSEINGSIMSSPRMR